MSDRPISPFAPVISATALDVPGHAAVSLEAGDPVGSPAAVGMTRPASTTGTPTSGAASRNSLHLAARRVPDHLRDAVVVDAAELDQPGDSWPTPLADMIIIELL